MENAPAKFVVAVDDANFEVEVNERSRDTLVLVDFWATWCAPCRLLGPILEELASESAGRFVLAKVETEKAPQAAARFGVSSIPAVFAVRDGVPIDGFVGAMTKEQIARWIEPLLPTPAQEKLAHARDLAETDAAGAEALVRAAIDEAPTELAGPVLLAELLLRRGAADEAAAVLAPFVERDVLDDAGRRVAAQVKLAQQAANAGDIETAASAAEASPNDAAAQMAYAEALAATGRHEEALARLLEVVQRNLDGKKMEAKDVMLELFELLPDDSELTSNYRRKLSMAMY